MAEPNGHNAVTAEMVEILRRMDGRLERLERLEQATRDGFGAVNGRLEGLEQATREGFRAVNGRLDNIIATMGETARDPEARLAKLETSVARLSARRSRPPAR